MCTESMTKLLDVLLQNVLGKNASITLAIRSYSLFFFYNYLFRVLNTSWHSKNCMLLKISFILMTCQLKDCDWKVICYRYRKVAIKILFWTFFPQTEFCPHGFEQWSLSFENTKCTLKLPEGFWKLLENCSQRILHLTPNSTWVQHFNKNNTKLRLLILQIAISRSFKNTGLTFHCYFKGHAGLIASMLLWKTFSF